MDKVFVVYFNRKDSRKMVLDSVFKNESDAIEYCKEQNDWEQSEYGEGDFWYWQLVDYHE